MNFFSFFSYGYGYFFKYVGGPDYIEKMKPDVKTTMKTKSMFWRKKEGKRIT